MGTGVLPDIVEGHGREDPKPSSTNTHAVSTFTQDHEVTGSSQDEQVSVAQDTPSQDKPELTPAEMVALHAEHRGADVSSSAFEGHVPAADGASVSSEPDNKKGSDATEVCDEVCKPRFSAVEFEAAYCSLGHMHGHGSVMLLRRSFIEPQDSLASSTSVASIERELVHDLDK